MSYTQHVGTDGLRNEFVERALKGFATRSYKFKQAVAVMPTASWTNVFWREDPSTLTGPTGNAIKGIPRGGNFPQAVVKWERVEGIIQKYGLEDNIFWEDIMTSEINVMGRTIFRLAEGVVKAVDDEIFAKLTESLSPTNIQSVVVSAGYEWDSASAAIIDNLEEAEQKIGEYNYSTQRLLVYINHKDKRSIINYLVKNGNQLPQLTHSKVTNRNGVIGEIGNKTFIVSPSVTASYALVLVPKICGTWKSLVNLSTDTKNDTFRSARIRAVEMGLTELTDPKSVVLISNTQS
jgi:hypothetical protein